MPSEKEQDTTFIARHVHDCFDRFQSVSTNLATAPSYIRSKLSPSALIDEFGRFRLWAGNVGAHREGRASLDYKLREASHIRERVIELLLNTITVLEELRAIVTSERRPWEDLTDSDSDGSSSGLEDHIQPMTELLQLLSNIAETNTCLMRLSMSIRNPAPHDQFKGSKHISFTHYESFDVDHAREKFPHAAEYLVVRVGKAISRRRQYLCYREEHRKKYEQGLSSGAKVPGELESTIASSLPVAIKALGSVKDLDEGNDFDGTLSQTSFASSNNDPNKLRPPPLPETGRDSQPFECPLCFRITSVRDLSAWRKHVFRDLQPYVCTFEQCDIPDHTYESRHEWFQHELQIHRGHWKCFEGCGETFQSSEQLRGHIVIAHSDVTKKTRLDDIITLCYRPPLIRSEGQCTFCKIKCTSLLQLRQHLGKHQEEVSLFALPSRLQGINDGGSDSEETSQQSIGITDSPLDPRLYCTECDLSIVGNIEQQLEVLQQHMTEVHVTAFEPASKIDFSRVCLRGASDSVDESISDGGNRVYVHHIPGHVNTWDGLKKYLMGSINETSVVYTRSLPMNPASSTSKSVTDDIEDPGLSAGSDRSASYAHQSARNIVSSDWSSISDVKQPPVAEIGRLVEAHGGSAFLNRHLLWANLGYDLDFGRELTEPEADFIRAMNIAYDLDSKPAKHPDAAMDTEREGTQAEIQYRPSSLPLADSTCLTCSATFSGRFRESDLTMHEKTRHNGRLRLSCLEQSCDKTFKRQDTRLKHMRKYHPGLIPDAVPRPERRKGFFENVGKTPE